MKSISFLAAIILLSFPAAVSADSAIIPFAIGTAPIYSWYIGIVAIVADIVLLRWFATMNWEKSLVISLVANCASICVSAMAGISFFAVFGDTLLFSGAYVWYGCFPVFFLISTLVEVSIGSLWKYDWKKLLWSFAAGNVVTLALIYLHLADFI